MTKPYYAQNLAHVEKKRKQLKFPVEGDDNRTIIIDGPVSPAYDEETCRLLWVLKEPNIKNEDGKEKVWSLIDFLRDNPGNGWASTFGLVVKVSKLLLHSGSKINEVATTPPRDLIDLLQHIAVINLNKFGGGARQSVSYTNGVEACAELVRWQFDNLDPSIIICGSTFKDLSQIIGLNLPSDGQIWPHKDRFPSFNNQGRIFISAYHPGVRGFEHQQYCERVLDALESGIECS